MNISDFTKVLGVYKQDQAHDAEDFFNFILYNLMVEAGLKIMDKIFFSFSLIQDMTCPEKHLTSSKQSVHLLKLTEIVNNSLQESIKQFFKGQNVNEECATCLA